MTPEITRCVYHLLNHDLSALLADTQASIDEADKTDVGCALVETAVAVLTGFLDDKEVTSTTALEGLAGMVVLCAGDGYARVAEGKNGIDQNEALMGFIEAVRGVCEDFIEEHDQHTLRNAPSVEDALNKLFKGE